MKHLLQIVLLQKLQNLKRCKWNSSLNHKTHQTPRRHHRATQPTVVLTVLCSTDALAACSRADVRRRWRDTMWGDRRAAEYDDCTGPLEECYRESQHMDHFRRTILGLSPELRLTNLAERKFMIWPQDWQRTTYWWQQPVHSWLWSWERTNCTTATKSLTALSLQANCHLTYEYSYHWLLVLQSLKICVSLKVCMNIHISSCCCSQYEYSYHWLALQSLKIWFLADMTGLTATTQEELN